MADEPPAELMIHLLGGALPALAAGGAAVAFLRGSGPRLG
jgi:hypothetical protein